MNNDLLLLAGTDIPFPEAQLTIHQPTLKEIAYVGENIFFTGCELLKFSKDSLNEEDKNALQEESNFNILMTIIQQKSIEIQQHRVSLLMILSLLFPEYNARIGLDKFILTDKEDKKFFIDNNNYEKFVEIIKQMFCADLLGDGNQNDYKTTGSLANKIADKLKKRHQHLAELNNEKGAQKISILSRYASILAVGESKDINTLMNYTVYQLFDEFTRFELKEGYDIHLKAQLAGATDLKEVDDWRKDIHP